MWKNNFFLPVDYYIGILGSVAARWKTAALGLVAVGAGIFAISVVSGLFYEQVQRARDRGRYPQIGRSVDIGGRSLNIYCSGSGQPAIILASGANWVLTDPRKVWENGGPHPGYSWVAVQRELAKYSTACWFDPAGSGWSDLGPYPRDSASQARDLHALLRGAGVLPPYLLVAESSAALDAHVYAGFYPADVAGSGVCQRSPSRSSAQVPAWQVRGWNAFLTLWDTPRT